MLKQTNEQSIKRLVILFAGATYLVGVGYADIMFLQIVEKAFPSGFLSGMSYAGAICTGLTAMLLPVALHWWFSPGNQFNVGVLFYIVDLALLGLNAILAYQISQGQVEGMIATWWQYSPATPVICVAGWGLAFALDQSHKLRHTQHALQSLHIETVARGMENAATSQEAQAYLNQVGINAMWKTAYDLSGQAIPQQLQISQQAQSQQPPVLPALPAPVQQPPTQTGQQPNFFSRLANAVFPQQQPPAAPVPPVEQPQTDSTPVQAMPQFSSHDMEQIIQSYRSSPEAGLVPFSEWIQGKLNGQSPLQQPRMDTTASQPGMNGNTNGHQSNKSQA